MKEFLQKELVGFGEHSVSTYQILMVAVVIAVTWFLGWGLRKVIVNRGDVSELERGRRLSLFKLTQYVLWVLTLLIVLEALGFKITLLLAGSAALLVGIGLGLQEVFKDFVSGIILLFDGTVRVSDIIEVDGIVGRVKEIRLRASEIETRDGIVMIIPNSAFITGHVINWTHNHKLNRFKIEVGVAYGSDVEKVRKVLIQCAKDHQDVVLNPEPLVYFSDFGESQLSFSLLFFSRSVFRIELVKSDIRFLIDKAFREEGITIPFPQRDVHMRNS